MNIAYDTLADAIHSLPPVPRVGVVVVEYDATHHKPGSVAASLDRFYPAPKLSNDKPDVWGGRYDGNTWRVWWWLGEETHRRDCMVVAEMAGASLPKNSAPATLKSKNRISRFLWASYDRAVSTQPDYRGKPHLYHSRHVDTPFRYAVFGNLREALIGWMDVALQGGADNPPALPPEQEDRVFRPVKWFDEQYPRDPGTSWGPVLSGLYRRKKIERSGDAKPFRYSALDVHRERPDLIPDKPR